MDVSYKKELVKHATLWNNTKSTCNNHNNHNHDDNGMHASLKRKSEMYNENICFLGFGDIREGVTLKRLIWQSLVRIIVI